LWHHPCFAAIYLRLVENLRRLFARQKAQQLIRAGVKRGIERRGEIRPYLMTRPIRLQIRFKDSITAELASYLPGVQRPAGDTVVISVRDMTEASKLLEVISSIGIRP